MFKLDLLKNEKILEVYRQTAAILLRPLLIGFLLTYLPWYFLLKYELAGTYNRLLIFWTFLVFLYAFHKYLLWLLNIYLLTNQRLIYVNYLGLFNKRVLESPLDRILNISFTTKGLLQSVFQYGAVEVQVAGLGEPMILKNLSHPSAVKDFLWKIHNQYGLDTSKTSSFEIAHEVLMRKPKTLN